MAANNRKLLCIISSDEYEGLRSNRIFAKLLQIARYQNQLSYCAAAIPSEMPEITDYRGTRQLINSLLFASSVLFEALETAQHLGRDFKDYPSYQNGFVKFWQDPDLHYIKDNYLNRFRKHVTFHVDEKPIADTLAWAEYKEIIFLAIDAEDYYFPLADNIGFTYVIGQHESDEKEAVFINEYLEKWNRVLNGFLSCANLLHREFMERRGWSYTKA